MEEDDFIYEEPAARELGRDRELSPPAIDDGPNENFKVAIRVRPPLPRELEGLRPFINVVRIPNDHKSITLCEHLETEDGRGGVYTTQSFTFDYVYDQAAGQTDVYNRSAKSAVLSVLQGYNSTMIAYGQTGTGKTFTMEGFTSDEQRGVIPRATEEIFSYIQSCRGRKMKFLVRASYLQIYNETVSDLLKPLNKNLKILQQKQRGVYVEGLSEWIVRSPHEIYGLMERGCGLRATGATKMSELSSRSHAIFIIIVEIMEGEEGAAQAFKIGKLNIVDLAGSEKVRQTGVTGQRLEETKKINWSLHELGNVIAALTEMPRKDGHIPYRNSKLTNLLKDSLGGNCKTTLVTCISPAQESYHESLSSLKFANRAKNIKNDAVVNEDLDQRAMLRKYEAEVKRLRALLAERESGAVGYREMALIQELEDRSRRAEEDREAAVEALRLSSRRFDEQIEVRRQLEERLEELQSKLGTGEGSEQLMMRAGDFEKERQSLEEDKAQVERYKQLLLSQRDIMLHLTTRLNERDEYILQLENEIDAYDAHVQMMEDAMECAAPTMSTKLDAEEHLSKCRIHRGTETLYRSERCLTEGTEPDALLSAEDKIAELLMLKGCAAPGGSWDRSDEKKSMELIIKERVDIAAKRICEEQLAGATRELDALRTRLAASEEKRRAAEVTVAIASRGSNEQQAVSDEVAGCFDAEARRIKEPLEARIRALQGELDQEKEQRRRLMRELDRHKFEMERISSLADEPQREEITRLWNTMKRVEDGVQADLLRNWTLSSPTTPRSSPTFPAPTAPSDAAAIEKLQIQMKKQQAELQQQLEAKNAVIRTLEAAANSAGAGARDKEISQLKRSLNTHVKDRNALLTIMETRMKPKVDSVAGMLGLLEESPDLERVRREVPRNIERVQHEILSLLNLTNASISALRSEP